MDFIIRRGTVDDLDLLTEMRLEMRRERETVPLTIPETEFRLATHNYFRQAVADESFIAFIAYAGDAPAGCAGLIPFSEPPTYSDVVGKLGYVVNVFTRPEWRRMGMASALMDAMVAYARSQGYSRLQLNASPMGAPVYQRYGFENKTGEMTYNL